MKEFNNWKEQFKQHSVFEGDSSCKPHFNPNEYITYLSERGRNRILSTIEIPYEVIQEERWREKWSDQ